MVAELVRHVEGTLLGAGLVIESVDPREPIVVRAVPGPWDTVGVGNYAAVFSHPAFPEAVVKVYAPGRPGHADEVDVYRRLGEHPAYSACLHAGEGYLVLRRLEGVTMFECLRRGLPIPPSAIEDIDRALADARLRGLHPHDVHAKNVMIDPSGRGLVVDVSDFGHAVACSRWNDLKRAYDLVYAPVLSRRPVPLPLWMLDLVRRSYRLWRRLTGRHD